MDENGTKVTKPFYKDLQDTLDDVEISARQLTYWRKEGLFSPELGERTRRYTQDDIDQLKTLKRLIVDLKLPVEAVRGIHARMEEEGFRRDDPTNFPFLSLRTGHLVLPSELQTTILNNLKWPHSTNLAIALIFRRLHGMAKANNARYYEGVVKDLLERIQDLEPAARVTRVDGRWQLRPQLEHDPQLSEEEFEDLFEAGRGWLNLLSPADDDNHAPQSDDGSIVSFVDRAKSRPNR